MAKQEDALIELPGRERILAAARTLFPQRGFAKTTVRDIAHAADVDVALIAHHFGNKRNLYEIATKTPIDPLDLAKRLKDIGPNTAGEAITRLMAELWLSPMGPSYIARIRAIVEEPGSFRDMRDRLDIVFWGRIRRELSAAGYPDADLRVDLAQTTLFGFFAGKVFLEQPELKRLDIEGIVDCCAPVVQWHLTGRPVREADAHPNAEHEPDPNQFPLF